MRIRANSIALYRQITQGAKLAPNKASQDILHHIWIKAEDDQLVVTGSDLTNTIRHYISDVEILEPGEILVPGDKLLKVLKGMGDEIVTITVGQGLRCVVTAPTAHFKVAGDDPADYPQLPEWDGTDAFKLPSAIFLDMLERVQFATSKDAGRWAMHGVRIEMTSSVFRMVGTDSRRLAMCERPGEYPAVLAATVPKAGLLLLSSLLKEDEEIEIRLDDDYLHLRGSKMELIARRLIGEYPPFLEVLPTDNELLVGFERSEFIKTLNRALLLTSKSTRAVKFAFQEDLLAVEALESATEEAHVEHEIEFKSDPMVVGFDARHLLEGIQTFSSENITLELKDENSSALVREECDGISCLYLIVPVSLPR
jgi:DNA polymerase-3 subunit beta